MSATPDGTATASQTGGTPTLDQLLAKWIAAYTCLKEAQADLSAAGSVTLAMRRSVAQLQREAEQALSEMQKECDLLKKRRAASTRPTGARPADSDTFHWPH